MCKVTIFIFKSFISVSYFVAGLKNISFHFYSLITHSTAIEGSTLTELDTQLLFDEGVTAKGKPLVYHLMNEDLKKSLALEIERFKASQKKGLFGLFILQF